MPERFTSEHDQPDDAEARIGSRLGNYVLQRVIGRGGMGVVYRAEHVYIHKPAAVKVLHRRYFDQPEARQRFLQEAQTASLVDHPNIVGVTDFGEAPDGTVYLVMSHVEGVGLDDVLRDEHAIPLFRALGIVSQVVRALGAAHARGVVHRDLKPENIMLATRPGRREIIRRVHAPDGSFVETIETEPAYDFVTVLDFGAAKFWHQSASALEDGGMVVGTPAYMAPETARLGVADARSDIYAVGVIFYEMLTGSVPFDGDDPVAVMTQQVQEPVEPPSQRNPAVEITPEAERVVLRALEKDPERRYASMDEMSEDLQRCFGTVRFRRAQGAMAAAHFEALREPEPTPELVPATARPVLLTRPKRPRRTGRHPTLPLPGPLEQTPAPAAAAGGDED